MLLSLVVFGIASGHFVPGSSALADNGRMVSLYADGQKRVLSAHAGSVGQFLEKNGIVLRRGDSVEPSAATSIPAGYFNVNVYRARPVTVVDGYRSYRFVSASSSPVQLAEQAGLTVYPEDTYDMNAVTDIVGSQAVGDRVVIDRAVPFLVKADGRTRLIRTQARTVGDALKEANIPLGLSDTVSVAKTTPVAPNEAVAIARVSEAVATVAQTVPRPVTTVTDPTLPKGTTAVRSEGADGTKTITYRVHYQDGVETGRDTLKVADDTAPQPKVMVVGTKVLFSGSVEYWRPLVIAAAAKYDYDPNTMMRIMACESTGNATTVSHFIVNGEHPTGLFQYLPSTWRAAGGTDDNILDGPTQIELTAKKMSLYGTSPWQCQ